MAILRVTIGPFNQQLIFLSYLLPFCLSQTVRRYFKWRYTSQHFVFLGLFHGLHLRRGFRRYNYRLILTWLIKCTIPLHSRERNTVAPSQCLFASYVSHKLFILFYDDKDYLNTYVNLCRTLQSSSNVLIFRKTATRFFNIWQISTFRSLMFALTYRS